MGKHRLANLFQCLLCPDLSSSCVTKSTNMIANHMLLRIGRSALKSHNTKQAFYQLHNSSRIFGVSGSRILSKHMSTQRSQQSTIYVGPLATVAKRLKLFSISSLGLSSAITPFVFVLDFPVPFFAKVVLVGSGIVKPTSNLSAIIQFFFKTLCSFSIIHKCFIDRFDQLGHVAIRY